MKRNTFTILCSAVALFTAATPSQSTAATFDLTADWSDSINPNGVWSYRESSNPLPHVNSWQSSLGGWTVAQPAWALSENGSNRLPTWFRSNGSENFTHDWLTGDIVVHSTDGVNGVGSGFANVTWTSPVAGTADLSGAIWMGRDIGRSNHWRLTIGGITVSEGDVASGDIYDRTHPFDFSAGSGGVAALNDIPVSVGTVIALQVEATSLLGDFVGLDLTIQTVPEPTSAVLLLCGAAICLRRRSLRPNDRNS